MNNLAVVGAQWGDEGKAKIVDYLGESASIVARYQGGANAGHTVVTPQGKFVFHLIPAGILRPEVQCVIGNGVVFDPEAFVSEIEQIEAAGIPCEGRVLVSGRAHLVLPYHKALDRQAESQSEGALGTTRRGIGPCYRTKAERLGILVADLVHPDRLRRKLNLVLNRLNLPDAMEAGFDATLDFIHRFRERILPFIHDTSAFLLDHLDTRKGGILFEGAQGAMLDLDHGTYPYVTSSSTTSAGIPSGLGIPPSAIHRTLGITKGYTTRVGEGWFPTEETGETGDRIRKIGQEYGATTGRPRRCGWLDLVALRSAVRLSGMDALALTKLDILDGFDTIRVAVAYRRQGQEIDRLPMHPEDLADCTPVYLDLPGWKEPLAGRTSADGLPENVRSLLDVIQKHAGVPVTLLSTGAARSELIVFADPWAP